MKSHRHEHGTEGRRADLPTLTERLRRKSRKITGPRQAILDVLRRHRHPMSSKEIFAALEAGNGDLVTVYRSMHLLVEMQMVKRFDLGDGVARYELLAEGDDGHHHHLVCTRCSAVVEIDECFTRELEERVARENGFKAITHRLEFFGICPECQ
jgi:Fur family ferric uptake transcriptional regulator